MESIGQIGHSEGNMKSLWQSIGEMSASSNTNSSENRSSFSSLSSSYEATCQSVNWMIINRGGLAFITGLVMVPSQFLGPDDNRAHEIIDAVCLNNRHNDYRIEKIFIEDQGDIVGIICYPKDWNLRDNSRCVLYNNPNAVTVPGYFEGMSMSLSWTPEKILNLTNCPLILYDYRGTGLSQDNMTSSSLSFRPTYETVVVDGVSALKYALKKFQSVEVWGSSLGGGVATTALDRYLIANPNDQDRVTLTNHDSFTTTSRVVAPTWPMTADILGSIVGGKLDAETSIKNLIARGIKVTVLCHKRDPVIPAGARMAEFIETLPQTNNLSLIYSEEYGHANLSLDLIGQLRG